MPSRPARSRYLIRAMQHDRDALGWNDRDLAARAGLSPATVSRFWSGKSRTPKTAKKLAEALGHPLNTYLAEKAA